jgi:hypothetical protein
MTSPDIGGVVPQPSEPPSLWQQVEDYRRRQKAAEETQLLGAFQAAMAESPDLAAERDRLTAKLKLANPAAAPTDIDVLRRMTQAHEARELLPTLTPMLRDRLKEVRIAKLVTDELGQLKAADGLFDWFGRAVEAGAGANELADLLARQALTREGGGELTPADLDRIAELKLVQQWTVTDTGWLDATVRTAAQIVGPLVEATAAGAAVAAPTLLGGPVSTATAFAAGSAADVFARSAYREFGNQYDRTYSRLTDAGTAPEEAHAIALSTAAAYGVGAGAVETGAHLLLLKPFAGAAKAVGERLLAKAAGQGLTQLTRGQAAKTFFRELLTSSAAEPVEEGVQQALSSVADNLAAALAGRPEAGTTFEQSLADIGDAMYQTAKGMALIAPLGPAIHFMAQQRAVTRAKAGAEFLTRLGEHIAEMKLATRSPDAAAELINAIGQDKDVAEVYVPAAKLVAALDATGTTRQQLAQDLPVVAERLAQAEKSDDDVAIPIGDYAAKIETSTLGPVLRPSVRTDKDGFSLDQAEEWLAEKDANQKAVAEKIAQASISTKAWNDEALRVEQRMASEIAAASDVYNPEQRRMLASLHRRYVETQAADLNMTPEQFDREHRLSVRRGPTEAAALEQFGGVRAQTAPLLALARARQLEANGISPSTVWLATGWARGADTQWRFEISDYDLRLTREETKVGVDRALRAKPRPLGEVIEHPKLFEAYPWLADVPISATVDLPQGVAGQVSNGEIVVSARLSEARLLDTIVHEVQHVIQEFEGFALGGNWTMAPIGEAEALARGAQRNDIERLRETLADTEVKAVDRALELNDAPPSDATRDALNAILDGLSGAGRKLYRRMRDEARNRVVDGDLLKFGAMEWYTRLAGETEARNAANRRTKGPGEMQSRFGLPEDTEDRIRSIQHVLLAADLASFGQLRDAPASEEPAAGMLRQDADTGARGGFDPADNTIWLNPKHDASTLLHEFSHYWLNNLFELAGRPGTAEGLQRRAQAVLDWFGVANLEAWNGLSLDAQRKHHEAWAYRAEADWFGTGEGAALSLEQHRAMRSFGRWIRAVYRDARGALNAAYRRQFGTDLPALTPEVRDVFDRMVASEDAVEAAKVQRELRPLFALDARPAGASDADWNAYLLALQDGADEATEKLTQQRLRAVKWLRDNTTKAARKLQAETRAERKRVTADERTRLENEPLRIAEQRLRHGIVDDNGAVTPFKLNLDEFRRAHPDVSAAALGTGPSGMLATNGMPHDLAAQMLGYPTGGELVSQLLAMQPFEEELQRRVDARMLAEHPEHTNPEAALRAVESALHNGGRLRVIAAELRWLAKVTASTQVMVRAARAHARDVVGRQRIGDVAPHEHAKREVRARRDAEKALVKGDHAAAVVAKRRELLEAQMEREALDVREEIEKLTALLRKMFKADAKLGKTRNVDYVAVARALAADLGLAPGEKTGEDYVAALREYNPALFERLAPILDRVKAWAAAGLQAGRVVKDWRDLSVDEFRDLHETIGALWRQSRREQQVVIDGKAEALDDAAGELVAQEAKLKRPKPRKPESAAAAVKRLAHQVVRPEHWAFRLDGAEKPGAFTRLFWRLVRGAVDTFSTERNKHTKRAVQLVEAIAPKLPRGLIEFRDTSGKLLHVFGESNGGLGLMELVGALLHTGNEGNFRRLVVGRGWAPVDEDGNYDASAWHAFVADAVARGAITKDVMDTVQALWDLAEELKPGAQRAHRDLFGYYFDEVEATPLTFTFGGQQVTYRGGYMPAKLDRSAASAARVQSLADIEQDARQQFATTGRGFTKSRVEGFAEPLLLDLRLVPSHIDDVLRFTHIQPAIRDVERLAKHPDVAPLLEARQPGVWNSMLLPWLQRVASQSVTKRGRSEDIDNFWRAARSSVGLSMMVGNLPNTLQQFTGLLVAAVKVPTRYLFRGLWRWFRGGLAREIAGKSPFMAHRQHNQTMESFERLNDLVEHRSKFAKARSWIRHHGYFLQSGLQNILDSAVWHGAYEHAIDTAGVDVSDADAHAEAVKQADAAVRMTQSSFDPTDVAGYEEGTPAYRVWTMFAGYFNTLANLQADQLTLMAQRVGFAKAGPAFMAYVFAFAAPMLLADAIAKTLRGQWKDDDDDGEVDVLTLDFLFGGQLRALAAEIPVAGPRPDRAGHQRVR